MVEYINQGPERDVCWVTACLYQGTEREIYACLFWLAHASGL